MQKKEQLQRQQEALTRLLQQQQELRTQLANLIAQKAYVLSSEPVWASLGQRLLQLQRQQNDLSAQHRPSGLFKRLCQTVSRKTEEFSLQKQLRQASQEGAAQLLVKRFPDPTAPEVQKIKADFIEGYNANMAIPWTAAERGYIDAVIQPHESRLLLRKSLKLLRDKQKHDRIARKHGLTPL